MLNLPHCERIKAKSLEEEASIHLLCRQLGFISGKSAILLGIVCLCVISVIWYLASKPESGSLQPETLKEIDTIVAEMHDKNVQAKGRALRSLRNQFSVYRRGIAAFADDINSWTSRSQILTLYVGEKIDRWTPSSGMVARAAFERFARDRKQVSLMEDYVGQKFRTYIFSEESLKKALKDAIDQYHYDLTANRNECLRKATTLKFTSAQSSTSQTSASQFTYLQDQVRGRIEEFTRGVGERSLAAEIASTTGGYILEPTIAVFLTRVAKTVVVFGASALVGPGLAGELAALFGGTGSTLGPAGTVIGFLTGCTIGLVIDSAMSSDLKERLNKDIGAFLVELERDIIEGPIKLPKDNQKGGLRDIFDEAGKMTEDAVRRTLASTYKGEKR